MGILRGKQSEQVWHSQSGLLSKHMSKTSDLEPKIVPFTWKGAPPSIWIAYYRDDKLRRRVEAGTDTFPENRFCKVGLPRGPSFQRLGLVALPTEQGNATVSAVQAWSCHVNVERCEDTSVSIN